jgi:hypothetical protein
MAKKPASEMNNVEFNEAIRREARRLSQVIGESEEDLPVVAAALSLVVGSLIASAATAQTNSRSEMEEMLATMIRYIKREAEEGYKELKDNPGVGAVH